MSIITTDMFKEIHKTNIRYARTPKLAELDIEFQKALETGADTSTIVAKKQTLRDAPGTLVFQLLHLKQISKHSGIQPI